MAIPDDPGVLLIAHGTVADLAEIPDFLQAIRRGRPASAALISEITRRYEAIGGSPLLSITEAQRACLESRLGVPVYVGMRFCLPTLEDAFIRASADGRTRLTLLPLAPYSVELYASEARRRYNEIQTDIARPLELKSVVPWGIHPSLVAAHCENIIKHAKGPLLAGAPLILSAHSLPLRVIQAGDRYADEVAASVQAIAEQLQVPCELGFQSEGADGGDWLGPSIGSILDRIASQGRKELIIAPIGFLCEHVETLYDLDIEFAAQAQARGITVHRVPTLGTHPKLIETLADLVLSSQ